jgi:parvulin-like peptidyl-prolyl isomerase
MSRRPAIRACLGAGAFRFALLAAVVGAGLAPHAAQPQTPIVLDRVVAVVNRQAILASDIDEEIRLSVLDPARTNRSELTRQHALDLLIGRSLIQQQIHREDMQAVEPTQDEINARVAEIRKLLPECVHRNCATEAGWKSFLATHDLTEQRVEAYFRNRLEILRFIEQRFRPGIHIPPESIEMYYRETLLPQYKTGEETPSLDEVAPRIEEILLQQQVNALFDEWLTNLRNQGDVEVLDPSLESPKNEAGKPSPPTPVEKGSK